MHTFFGFGIIIAFALPSQTDPPKSVSLKSCTGLALLAAAEEFISGMVDHAILNPS